MIKDQHCWCITCRPITMTDMRFVVCPDCGNKRCPKANDHHNDCTNSNEVGQKGSSWEHVKPMAQPEQEPVAWNVIDPLGKVVATETNAVRGWARIAGYKPTVEGLLGFHEQGWRVVPTSPQPAQPSKPWVNLTDEEMRAIVHYTQLDNARLIEAKLREKNAQPIKPWVGLTKEDKQEIIQATGRYDRGYVMALVEAMLQEKNT